MYRQLLGLNKGYSVLPGQIGIPTHPLDSRGFWPQIPSWLLISPVQSDAHGVCVCSRSGP